MHRALLIHEIAVRIAEWAVALSEFGDINLLNLAFTCKAWSEIALDALWSTIHDLHHVLRLIPGYRYAEGGGAYGWGFTRPISQLDLDRFRYYAGRIRTLDMDYPGAKIDVSSVLRTLNILKPPHHHLFPELRSLRFELHPMQADLAAICIGPRLQTVEIHFRESDEGEVWMTYRPDVLRRFLLQLVKFPTPVMINALNLQLPTLDYSHLTLVAGLRSLSRLSLCTHSMLNDPKFLDSLRQVCSMPSVVDLIVHIYWWGPERDHDHSVCFRPAASVFGSRHTYAGGLPSLGQLAAVVPEAPEMSWNATWDELPEEWEPMFEALFQRPAHLLRSLGLHSRSAQSEQPPPTAMLRMPLYDQLRELNISVPFDWTDEAVVHVACSCPALASMSLLFDDHPDDSQLYRVSTTPRVLASLAITCDRLERLRIHVNPRLQLPEAPATPTSGFEGNTRLLELYVRFLPAFDYPAFFEEHVKKLYPKLKKGREVEGPAMLWKAEGGR
ncbi:hypothetical protein PUNSTDRAFT_139760 [Punctularia strigosozonata HHB-11173 SS5]|uniref:uncharacterized protein n=1 Tax=Punctularia strigosozonata (strain HHB-11173) TaxID=741275 RepID=UPI000441836F|nr:uncharacterized protein PUNSTDRAFT_139760 [Punctularia strigosozonata HHB-11173 SS5]EIN13094.1 hypothetical protein PUNSTDRAFT_139760 [Punctularia strigosozonata HHB-11173 SS5]